MDKCQHPVGMKEWTTMPTFLGVQGKMHAFISEIMYGFHEHLVEQLYTYIHNEFIGEQAIARLQHCMITHTYPHTHPTKASSPKKIEPFVRAWGRGAPEKNYSKLIHASRFKNVLIVWDIFDQFIQKIFEGEMLIKTHPTTLLRIF